MLVAAASCDGSIGAPPDEASPGLAPPSIGFQLALGPVEVPQGKEMVRCFWRRVPAEFDITRFEAQFSTGSHRVGVFSVNYPMPDGDFDCSVKPNGPHLSGISGLDPSKDHPRLVVGFQGDKVDWSLPDGIGYRLRMGQQLIIQVHVANVSPDASTARLYEVLNFHAASEPVVQRAETLVDDDDDLFLPAKSSLTLTRVCEFPEPVNIIGMMGHFHSRGKRHRVWNFNANTGSAGEPPQPSLYENTTWDAPPFMTMGKEWKTPIPSIGIKMIAEYDNSEDRDIAWGNFAADNEHFKTFAFYYPAIGVRPECVCHREGEEPQCEPTESESGAGGAGAGGAGAGGAGAGAGGASCTDQYGTVPGFELCEETATTCSFYALKNGLTSCAELCQGFGGSCVNTLPNSTEHCVPSIDETVDCNTSANIDDICVCTLGSG